jgi:hypothetical protein
VRRHLLIVLTVTIALMGEVAAGAEKPYQPPSWQKVLVTPRSSGDRVITAPVWLSKPPEANLQRVCSNLERRIAAKISCFVDPDGRLGSQCSVSIASAQGTQSQVETAVQKAR